MRRQHGAERAYCDCQRKSQRRRHGVRCTAGLEPGQQRRKERTWQVSWQCSSRRRCGANLERATRKWTRRWRWRLPRCWTTGWRRPTKRRETQPSIAPCWTSAPKRLDQTHTRQTTERLCKTRCGSRFRRWCRSWCMGSVMTKGSNADLSGEPLDTIERDPNGKGRTEPGAKLDAGKNRLGLVLLGFSRALQEVGKVGTYGAGKYSDDGWIAVPDGERRYTDAMLRHLMREATGEDCDPDTGLAHAAHTAWNALARLELALREGVLEPHHGVHRVGHGARPGPAQGWRGGAVVRGCAPPHVVRHQRP